VSYFGAGEQRWGGPRAAVRLTAEPDRESSHIADNQVPAAGVPPIEASQQAAIDAQAVAGDTVVT
jgi:hypothetical protein